MSRSSNRERRFAGKKTSSKSFRELKNGDIDGVVCSNLDRLVRPDRFEDFAVFDHFRLNRKCIYTPGEVVDPATQNGFLVSGVRGLLAGIERQLILSRTQAGKEEKRKRGLHPGGAKLLPRGIAFDRKTGTWSYVEPHASRMRLAYQLLFEEKSFYSMAAQVGGGWTSVGIKKALMNPLWMGVRRYPPTTGDRKEALEVRVIAEADALIDRATWEKAQAIIATRGKAWKMTKRPPRFLLAGLLRCSCGKAHYVRAKWKHGPAWQREYYYCGSVRDGQRCGARSYSRESVEGVVERLVVKHLNDRTTLRRIIEMTSKRTEATTDPKKIERELAKLEAKRKRTVDLAVEGIISKDELKERLAKLDVEARELRALLPAPAPAVDTRRIVEALVEAFAEFAVLSFADKRSILQRAFREFVIESGAISSATLNGSFMGGLASTKCKHI